LGWFFFIQDKNLVNLPEVNGHTSFKLKLPRVQVFAGSESLPVNVCLLQTLGFDCFFWV